MPPEPAIPAESPSPAAAPSALRGTLLRSAAAFSVATVASQGSGFVRSYYVARALGPAVAGVWIGLQLVVTYGANAHLGAIFGMHRNVPLLRGSGDSSSVPAVERTTLGFTMLMGAICFALVAAAGFGLLAPLEPLLHGRPRELLSDLRQPDVRSVVLGTGAVLWTNLLRSYFVTLFKAHNRFRQASEASMLGSLVGLLGIPFMSLYGLAGVVWGQLALIAAELLYLVARSGTRSIGLSWPVLRAQLAIGLPTVAVTLVGTALASVDRTVLIKRFVSETRGLYFPATLAMTFFSGLAAVPNAILYPRLSERFGATGDPAALMPLVDGPLRMVAAALAFVAGAAAIGAPAVIRLAMPQFVGGTEAAQIAMLGIACYLVVGVVLNVFSALNRLVLYFVILALAAAGSYGLTELLVRHWFGLAAVAAGTSLGYLGFAALVVVIGWWVMEQPLSAALRALGHALGPVAWAGVCAFAIVIGVRRGFGALSITGGLLGELAFVVLMGPWLTLAVRRGLRRDNP